jgi:hypothetical protein
VAPTPTERRALDCDYLKKLEESMPRRLLEVLEREGNRDQISVLLYIYANKYMFLLVSFFKGF